MIRRDMTSIKIMRRRTALREIDEQLCKSRVTRATTAVLIIEWSYGEIQRGKKRIGHTEALTQ